MAAKSSNAEVDTPALFSLKSRSILVTGGGGGLGISLLTAILESGADVICVDLSMVPPKRDWDISNLLPTNLVEDHIRAVAAKHSARATYHCCDITSAGETKELFAAVLEGLRYPLTGVVACAGIQQMIPILQYPVEAFRKVLDVNITGTFLTAQEAARAFRAQNVEGSIVLISSMSGSIANKGLTCTAYNTSKSAVHQLCRSMAAELGMSNEGAAIRVNSLSPGYIRTAMTDQLLVEKPYLEAIWLEGSMLGRLATPDEFRAPVVFLLSAASSFVTGMDLRVDGGHCAW